MTDIDVRPVVIIPADEYDRLVAAASAFPVMETVKRFRAADAVWAIKSIERRDAVAEFSEVIIIGSRPRHGFRDAGGPGWDEGKP